MKWAIWIFSYLTCSALAAEKQQVLQNKDEDSNEIHKRLIEANIIPDIIPDFNLKYTVSVIWPSNATARLGNAIRPDDVQEEPTLLIERLQSEKSYKHKKKPPTITVAMTDPDAPSQSDRKWSEFCHWIVTKVPIRKPCKRSTTKLSKQKDIMSYRPPGPPENTGYHRYVFVAFEFKHKKHLHLDPPSDRKRWGSDESGYGVAEWAEKYDLIPVGANFIYVQNEKQDG